MQYPTYEVTLSHPESDDKDEVYSVYLDLMLDEADVLRKFTAQQYTWRDWLTATDQKEPDALRFMYWLARKRAGNPIEGSFSDITFYLHELTWTVSEQGDLFTEADTDTELTGADPTEGVVTESN